jgi:hypothetical protein
MEDKLDLDKFEELFCMIKKLDEKVLGLERELKNVQCANVSQTIIIDRAISNVGKLIKELGSIK